MIVKSFKSTRVRLFLFFLAAGVTFYLVDCLISFTKYPQIPWFETGIYAGGPAGFYLTVVSFVAAFGCLLFKKTK
jgi:hypothetical protein